MAKLPKLTYKPQSKGGRMEEVKWISDMDNKRRLKALDLLCCAGGASMGLFPTRVWGHGGWYKASTIIPFQISFGRCYDVPAWRLWFYLGFTTLSGLQPFNSRRKQEKPPEAYNLIAQTNNRQWNTILHKNVAGAKKELINPVMLCGSMFGLRTQRHRFFETSFRIPSPQKLRPFRVAVVSNNSQ